MTQRSLFSSTALALTFAVTPAFADLAAKDVWQVWQDQVAETGQMTITGDESMLGNALIVSNATYSGTFEADGEAIEFSATMPEISFFENDDGTVSVTMADTYELPMCVTADGANIDIVFDVVQTGYEMTASGTADEMVQEFSAPMMQLTLASLPVADLVGAEVEGSILITGAEGRSTRIAGEIPTVSSETSVAAMVVNATVIAPEDEGDAAFNLTVSEISSSSTSVGSFAALSATGDIASLSEMLEKGVSTKGFGSMGALTFEFGFEDRVAAFQSNGTIGNSSIEVDFGKDGFAYSWDHTNVALDVQTSEFPLPIEIALREFGIGLKTPIAASDEDQDFGMSFTIADLLVNDEIWGIVDPAEILPRTPITASFDISGTGKLFTDLFDLEGLMSNEIPGQLNEVALNTLMVKGGGAEITGNGAFTVDNDTIDPLTGLPTPVGELTLRAEGVNGLIDNLISMGLLPEEEAMGARMMMGMFTVVEGDDVLTTKIEAGADGSVSANGQRIK